MSEPFSTAFAERGPFGALVGIHLPLGVEPPPEQVSERLHPEEREALEKHRGRRAAEWAGGRLAMRLAAQELGAELGPVLRGPRGEPLLPERYSGSISHKRRLAVALLGLAEDGTVGVDLEEVEPARMSILGRVLRPEEEATVLELPEEARWGALLERFAIKEAVYKALHPHLQRYVGFTEASISKEPGGPPRVALHLEKGEGPFRVEVHTQERDGLLLAQARVNLRS